MSPNKSKNFDPYFLPEPVFALPCSAFAASELSSHSEAFGADGEHAEQLCARFCKESFFFASHADH